MGVAHAARPASEPLGQHWAGRVLEPLQPALSRASTHHHDHGCCSCPPSHPTRPGSTPPSTPLGTTTPAVNACTTNRWHAPHPLLKPEGQRRRRGTGAVDLLVLACRKGLSWLVARACRGLSQGLVLACLEACLIRGFSWLGLGPALQCRSTVQWQAYTHAHVRSRHRCAGSGHAAASGRTLVQQHADTRVRARVGGEGLMVATITPCPVG